MTYGDTQEMEIEIVPSSACKLLWPIIAIFLMVTGCTSSQPECSDQVDPDLLTRAELAVFRMFEDDFGREYAENTRDLSEIREARTCGGDLIFEYWPKSGVVGVVYSMSYDVATGKVHVTGVD